MIRLGLGALIILAGLTAGCQSRPAGWDAAVSAEALAEVGLAYYWQSAVPLDSDEAVSHIWHLDENVYCLTDKNRLCVYDANSGSLRWFKQLGRPRQRFFSPAHVERVILSVPDSPSTKAAYNVVIFNTVADALLLRRDTGELLRKISFTRAGFAANTATVSDGTMLYVASVKAECRALELATGLKAWKLGARGFLTARPAFMGSRLYFAGHDGTLYGASVGLNRGRKVWPDPDAPQAAAGFVNDFVVESRGIFAGCEDYSVYAFKPTGQPLWRFRCGAPITRAVQVGATNVYATTKRKLYAIDLATGRLDPKWTLDDAVMVLAEVAGDTICLNRRNELVLADAAAGQVRRILPMAGLDLFVPNAKIPAVYAASTDGLVCCLRSPGDGKVTLDRLSGPIP